MTKVIIGRPMTTNIEKTIEAMGTLWVERDAETAGRVGRGVSQDDHRRGDHGEGRQRADTGQVGQF
jgi:hypothetical protein